MPTISKAKQAVSSRNRFRKVFGTDFAAGPLAVSEAVAIGEAIERVERPKAEAAQQEGRRKGGGDRRSEKAKRSRKSLPKAKQDESARTTAQAAEAASMSRPTYEKAKAVIESGDTELVAEMDRTGKTQAQIGTLLGVARQTVAVWLTPNTKDGNRRTPDSRVKIPVTAHSIIAERIERGDTELVAWPWWRSWTAPTLNTRVPNSVTGDAGGVQAAAGKQGGETGKGWGPKINGNYCR